MKRIDALYDEDIGIRIDHERDGEDVVIAIDVSEIETDAGDGREVVLSLGQVDVLIAELRAAVGVAASELAGPKS